MRYLIAIAGGVAASVVTAFLAAVVLGILNVFLAERGISWPSRAVDWRFVHMSFLDAILVAICLIAFGATFLTVTRATGRDSRSDESTS